MHHILYRLLTYAPPCIYSQLSSSSLTLPDRLEKPKIEQRSYPRLHPARTWWIRASPRHRLGRFLQEALSRRTVRVHLLDVHDECTCQECGMATGLLPAVKRPHVGALRQQDPLGCAWEWSLSHQPAPGNVIIERVYDIMEELLSFEKAMLINVKVTPVLMANTLFAPSNHVLFL